MKYLKSLNEIAGGNIEINNDIKDHLSQYPFLDYSIRDLDDGVMLTFGRASSVGYIKGLLDPYIIKIIEKKPIKIKVTGNKKMDDYSRFKNKPIIGNLIKIDFPHFRIKSLPAKSDTGATVSSLHSDTINVNLKKGTVTFKPLDAKYDQFKNRTYTFPLEAQIRVQSSNGDEEIRPMIKLDIIIDEKKYQTYFTLANREELEYPVLLGKDLLSNFLIDAGIKED